MILHTETSKLMYNWSFLFVVLHKPTLLPSTFKVPNTLYLVVVHPEVLLQEGFLRADESGVLLRYAFCSDSGMFNLVLNPPVLYYATSFGRLFQFEITSGKNESASCVVEKVLDVTSYCSSWNVIYIKQCT